MLMANLLVCPTFGITFSENSLSSGDNNINMAVTS